MNLETIKNRLQRQVELFNENNQRHESINDSVLNYNEASDAENCEKEKPINCANGFLSEIYFLLDQIDSNINFQTVNISETKNLIFAPSELKCNVIRE